MTTGLNSLANLDGAQGDAPQTGAAAPTVSTPVRWPADVTALISAAFAALAVHTALKQHLALDPAALVGAAVLVFTGLIGLHIALRVEPGPISEPAAENGKRRKKKKALPAGSDMPPALAPQPHADMPVQPVAASTREHSTKTALPPRAPLFDPPQPGEIGFDRLQVLVAELARTAPGPKAQTPDPDRKIDAPAPATDRAFADALERSHSSQARALSNAARLMHEATGASGGLAAELVDALSEDRLTVYLEPIQQMETNRPRHYEISVRFQSSAGTELPHEALMASARHAGLLPRIDAALVPRAARIAQHFQLRGRDTDILARVHGVSLPDHEFRAEVTAAAIAADGAAPVLSFTQSDVRSFGRIHWDILSALSEIGVRFAIESVTDLDMNFEKLGRQGFAFVKLDADVLLRGLAVANGIVATADVCRHFNASGLALVVTHIDDDAARARIARLGVMFGQGAVFGGRRAVRADLLTNTRVAAA